MQGSILQKHQHLLHNSCSVPSQHWPSVLLTQHSTVVN
jgi:hypothetical protein